MMQSAVANAFFTSAVLVTPTPIIHLSGNNVVSVDFKRKQICRPVEVVAEAVAEVSDWREIATSRISALHRLKDGWDGDGSRGPSEAVLAWAGHVVGTALKGMAFQAPPVAVPCADGSVQLEWWLVDTRFELIIEDDGAIEAWAQDRASGYETSANGVAAIELLSKWSGRLTADKLALPA